MRAKITAVAISLLCCVVFCACTSGITVEELLAAPSLTADQSSVIEAISSSTEEKTTLKYPTGGDRRAPVQFVDLDGDGASEAVAFYSVVNGYARMGVLKKTDGKWGLVSSIEGPGTDVESISVINLSGSSGRYLLVEWSSINSREAQLAAYHFDGSEILLGFEEACSDILVYDADDDGYSEFCYITSGSAYERFRIKFVDNTDGSFFVMGECLLSSEMISPAGLAAGKLEDGRRALFVDENISDTEIATEVFTVWDGVLTAAQLDEGYDIFELTRRDNSMLQSCAVMGGDSVYLISSSPRVENVLAPGEWQYLYTINDGAVEYYGTACVISEYGATFMLPDSWLAATTLVRDSQNTRRFYLYDTELEINALTLCVLEVGEDATGYVSAGYVLAAKTGTYRYYLKGTCPEDDFTYIRTHFALL